MIGKEGRIDILAKDRDNKLVILELKIANDKHLIWQVMYYPYILQSMSKHSSIRVMTVCPSYPEYILNPLKNVKDVEIIQYKPLISNGKIEKLDFTRIN